MKINKLTASFGKLENDTLKLHEGLNVIYAPNESGKSTWCAFIRAMLYGVDSSQRSRAGFLPDKLRYAPWSGAPMEGSMEVTADRCDITISRTTKTKSAPMREFSATYTGSGVPVEGITAANCGEMLTGVTRDVFRRSAFVEQGTVAVTGSPELEKRISTIVSTGEEQVSYSEADEMLRSWLRRRRFNRRGLIPQLEGAMDDVQRRLSDMDISARDIEEMENRLEDSRRHCAQLEAEVTEARKKQRREALEMLHQGREELKERSERHDEALAVVAQRRDELRAGQFQGQSLEAVEQLVDNDMQELKMLREQRKKRPSLALALLFFVLSAVFAGLYAKFQYIYMIVAAAVGCLVAVVLLMRFSAKRSSVQQALDWQRQILSRYSADNPSQIIDALNEHRRLWGELQEAEEQEYISRLDYEDARAALEKLEEAALGDLDFTGGSSPAALLSRELSAERANAERISAQIASLQGRLAATGDPLVLSSELSRMEDEYEQLNREYDAIALAVDTLRAADEQIQSRFSPQLGKLAGHYMSIVTGGRYSDIFINRDFSAKIRTADDAVARESEYLSAGTIDLLYLAVRLAVCELALPDGETCPLIIDDALVNLDEQRFDQAMLLLKEIAKTRQVVLFTCRAPKPLLPAAEEKK